MTTIKYASTDQAIVPCDGVALLAQKNQILTSTGSALDKMWNGAISANLRAESFRIRKGNLSVYYPKDKKLPKVFVAAFPEEEIRSTELRDLAYLCTAAASQHGVKRLAITFDEDNEQDAQAIGEGALLATYRYHRFKSRIEKKPPVASIIVYGTGKWKEAVRRAEIFARATMMVRDLVNEPPNLLTPLILANIAEDTARKNRLHCRIFKPNQLEKLGARAFLSVGKGSPVPSRMIHLTYQPKGRPKAHVALVGKGITFDSGGLSLKSEKAMEHMKSDMAGAATVLACAQAAKDLKLPIKVTAILMVTENMPGGGANRPGDIVRAMNGKMIEITNTDAEGRLALADGLTYAQRLKPDYLLDVATLTGAQVISLGRLIGAVMTNNEELANKIVAAGVKTGERMWPLPLYRPYEALIKSDSADLKNSSGIPDAGSIQGGLFLSEFVTHSHWAHLDIAGPSWQDQEWSVFPRNASGFGARCLLAFLTDLGMQRSDS